MSSAYASCGACQRRVLVAFTSLAGLPFKPARSIATRPRLEICASHGQRPTATRSFHTLLPSRQQQFDHQQPTEDATSSVAVDTSATPSVAEAESSVPWYLRVETPKPLATSLAPNLAAQEIPPLPEDSPKLLEPVLHHLSITIGLDNLTILDLRDLSPPSALGTNLIMVLGTARSQKHLNTSADRFCRWLRSTYKLRPYADGLMGRNEMKLKLRRKNKKLKLAQSVGNTMYDQTKGHDDGMTTGWICCNLGAVDKVFLPDADESEVRQDTTSKDIERALHPTISQKDQERILEDEDEYNNPSDEDFKYRGFGTAIDSPRIVVQMFVEEKRLEMDLEGLWETRLKRRNDKAERQGQRLERTPFETSQIEAEIETPAIREGLPQSSALGGIAAS